MEERRRRLAEASAREQRLKEEAEEKRKASADQERRRQKEVDRQRRRKRREDLAAIARRGREFRDRRRRSGVSIPETPPPRKIKLRERSSVSSMSDIDEDGMAPAEHVEVGAPRSPKRQMHTP